MGRKPYRKHSSLGSITGIAVLVLVAIALFIQYILPLLLLGGAGYGIYKLATRKSSLQKVNTTARLQELKESIGRCDRQLKLLANYLDEKDYTQYAVLANQVLPQLDSIDKEAKDLKNDMDFTIYKRIIKKTQDETNDITAQLHKLHVTPNSLPKDRKEKDIYQLAPEILETYQNIQTDHQLILEKLKEAENKAELEAIHDINMKRFDDILQGYLQIKQSPKDYYNADERLAQAKAALEKFDEDLDETLRQLNESQLSDFDISLRMMEQRNAKNNDI
ncbi:hypothetical protein [Streptococcus saliviloxodontae]|uniref:Membrane associated protein n=1 Tax=Streptococcus saliviloxodontae TaxID=1349416 RepID=A0ABS2PMH9_9STRE|nr:hypothetical protein [Streptococcus saliviloxodontae]MBM7636301.1 hypothetical protein [Streptococcus saliviloxodontae]